MRIRKQALILSAIIALFFILLYFNKKSKNVNENHFFKKSTTSTRRSIGKGEIVIAVVACGMRLDETLNMIKSAIIFAVDNPLKFIIITEPDLMIGFREKLGDWQNITKHKFKFRIQLLTFPEENEREWKELFKPCAAQRLFLPEILTDIDSVLYVDTDTLFLSSVKETWNHFYKFNASQIAGLSPEHEDRNVGWYNRFARHPFYGPLGVNSGVMLMNLTRMRKFKWNDHILPIHKEYKLKITWGDQDLINILFHFNSEKLYVFPCQYNYRPDHCMYMSVCKAPDGVQILHGNRGYFHADKQPVFSIIYRLIEEYQLDSSVYQNLLVPLESALSEQNVRQTNCGKISDLFLIKFRETFRDSIDYDYS